MVPTKTCLGRQGAICHYVPPINITIKKVEALSPQVMFWAPGRLKMFHVILVVTRILALGIQSYSQMMIGVFNHRNEPHSIRVPLPFSEGEPGSLGLVVASKSFKVHSSSLQKTLFLPLLPNLLLLQTLGT